MVQCTNHGNPLTDKLCLPNFEVLLRKIYLESLECSKTFCIFATIKVLSGLAHVKLMPVGGWCDKRLCRMENAKITVSSFGNGSIEQVFEYANHGLFISFPGDYAL